MRTHKILFAILAAMMMASCVSAVDKTETKMPTEPAAQPETPFVVPTADEGQSTGEAVFIHDVALLYDDPASGIAEIKINGSFPDGCTSLMETVQKREGSTITIHLVTTRPLDAACTMALKPFVTRETVDVSNMPEGEIVQVDVYGFKIEFAVGQNSEPYEGG